jgi:hypothetical protein
MHDCRIARKETAEQRMTNIENSLKELDNKLNTIMDKINDNKSLDIELRGFTSKWLYPDIKAFINAAGEVADSKYDENFRKLDPREQHAYNRMDIYNKTMTCLSW